MFCGCITNTVLCRFAPVRLAPLRSTLKNIDSDKSELAKLAPDKLVFEKSVFVKFRLLISWLDRSIFDQFFSMKPVYNTIATIGSSSSFSSLVIIGTVSSHVKFKFSEFLLLSSSNMSSESP